MKLPTQVFVSSSRTEPSPDRLEPVTAEGQYAMFWKPRGGLWTSTLDDEGGDWMRWCRNNGYDETDTRFGGEAWLLEPTEARVAVVATPYDLLDLLAEYAAELPPAVADLRCFKSILDWQRLAVDYDALWISDPHPYRLLWGGNEEEYDLSIFFNVMDAESTIWFRWCFEGEPTPFEALPSPRSL